MKRFLLSAAVAIAIVMPAFAEDEVSPERLALAKQVIEVSGATKVYDNYDKNLDAVLSQMLKGMPDPDPTALADIKKMAVEEFQAYRPQLMEGSAQIYARHYSEADLRALLAFYQSDAGKHFAAEMPAVSADCMKLLAPFAQHFMARVKEYVAAKAATAQSQKSKDK